ncbi:MAG: T9SS C-terminal target domain-containing protein [Candidatus Thermochlorobacter aerophilum]|uniref:T9SS C-terminal target domain-containing protein n=1 Tax=Candidatus Thermochlorobacter aerophilus TaxID=1868324 RepID=A0A395M4R6_9BACT|nr:MAG: T9SS C-terminal target domain-containing protein [Candidatus Thermochlorobacter aerophilum]
MSLGLASPNCNGGSATLDVQGNFIATSRIGIVCNGRLAGYSQGSVGSMTLSVGTLNTANTGNFIISNTDSRFNGNGPGTTTPRLILRGGTLANPATYNVPYVVFTDAPLANASTVMDIDGVYNVVNGSSVTIAAVPARRLLINGTLIVEDDGEIAGANVGTGSTSPRLEMGPNGRLVVRDPNGLGNGSSATPFAFCITRRGAPQNWNLTGLASAGTVEYNGAGPSNTQRITDLSTATPATSYNNLEINNPNGSLTIGSPPSNPCIADGVVAANSLIIRRGVCVLTPTTGSGTLTHPIGNIVMGSATSSTNFSTLTSNTALVVNNRANTTVNLNVTGNVTGDPSATGGVLLIMGGQSCNAACVTNFNISGNFNFSIPLFFAGNTSITTSGSHTLNLGGNFIISSPNSRFNAYRFTATPGNFQVNFTGTSATYTVPPEVLLGTAGNQSNVLCNWQVNAGASLTMTSGSVLACNNGRSLSVQGVLTCQDGAELIATTTGTPTGSSILTMGSNGRIRLADPQGLGDGTVLNPVSNFPLFIRRTAAGFAPPASNWDLTSISSNGTIEYNGIVTQAVTARTYNNLVINNTGGIVVSNPSPPPFFLFNNPNIVEGNITANSVELWRGVFILTPVGSGGSFAHTFGTLSIGSATSSTTFPSSSNTVLVINNRPSSTVTLTVTGNVSGASSATGGVGMVMGGINCNNLCNTTLTVNGNFTFSVPLFLAGNLSFPAGSGTNTLQFGGNVTLANTCRFSGDRFGVGADPTIRLTGASATFTVPSVVWLGTGGETNILAKWEIPTGASITLPSGSSIACSNGRNFTLNGTLIAQDGAEMIATQTGPTPPGATSNLIMGTNATLRIGDVHGMGTGALIGSNPLLPPPNAPTFFRQQSPASGIPNSWNLTSINTNGTVDYNGTALQTITARNASTAPNTQYHRLTISGSDKTLESTNGSVFVNDQLTLQGGIVSSVNASDVVRVLNTATGAVTRTSGHINARLERTLTGTGSEDYFYPIGDADDYRPLTLNDVTASSAIIGFREIRQSPRAAGGTFPPPPGEVSNVRYWLGSRVSGTWTGAQSISLDYGPNDGVDAGGTSVVMAHRSNTINGPYDNYGQSAPVPANAGTLTSASFPAGAFSTVGQLEYFTLGTLNPTDNPLPVELVGFKGEATVLGVMLEWQTASERDNAGFMLVRNGEVIADYREHAALRGAGTSAVGRRYRFIDERVREGERYVYALRSVDFDGTVHDYAVRVEVEGKRVSREYELMQNYPNPFNPVTTIRYVLPEESAVWVRVYDMLGRMVKEVVGGVRQGAGVYEVRFEGSGLGSGVYVYRLEAVSARGRYVASKKMVLMK